MKRPWVYMSSPSRSPHPPPSPPAPTRSYQSTRSERLSHASNLGWCSVSPLIVYMFRCCSLETSHPRLLPQSLNDCSITAVHYMSSSFAAFKVSPFPLPRVVSLKVQLGISMFFLFEGYWAAWIYRLFLSNFGSFQQLFFSSSSLRVYLILPYRLLKLRSLFFQLLLFYSSYWIVSIKQSLNSLIHLSAVWNLLLGPSGDFFCF